MRSPAWVTAVLPWLRTMKWQSDIPYTWLERTAEALSATHKAGIRYPVPFHIPAECDLPPDYITSEQDAGLS